MAIYECLVYDKNGERKNLSLEFDSQKDLNFYAIENKYKIVRIKKKKELKKQKLKDKDLSNICEQLGILLSSGCEITKSLKTIQFSFNHKLKSDLKKVSDNLQKGNSISSSFQKTNSFPNFFIHMIKAGEISGRLDEILLSLSKYYKKEHEFKTKLLTSMIYPTILIFMLIMVVIFMLAFAVPNLKESFISTHTQLPNSTKLLIVMSDLVRYNFEILIILMILGIIIFYNLIFKSEKIKYKFDKMIFEFKYTKEIVQAIEISKFTRCFYILNSSGIQILNSLDISTDVIKNKFMYEKMNISKEVIQKGYSITTSLSMSNVFPNVVIAMMQVGEETGNLEQSLKNINSNYDSNLETLVNRILKIVEPMIIVVIAISVGAIVISIMIPIFDAITSLK